MTIVITIIITAFVTAIATSLVWRNNTVKLKAALDDAVAQAESLKTRLQNRL